MSNKPQNAHRRRRGICALCKELKPLKGQFCEKCDNLSKTHGIQKREGECEYGRCVKPVQRGGFLDFNTYRFCRQHQNRHDRGIL